MRLNSSAPVPPISSFCRLGLLKSSRANPHLPSERSWASNRPGGYAAIQSCQEEGRVRRKEVEFVQLNAFLCARRVSGFKLQASLYYKTGWKQKQFGFGPIERILLVFIR